MAKEHRSHFSGSKGKPNKISMLSIRVIRAIYLLTSILLQNVCLVYLSRHVPFQSRVLKQRLVRDKTPANHSPASHALIPRSGALTTRRDETVTWQRLELSVNHIVIPISPPVGDQMPAL